MSTIRRRSAALASLFAFTVVAVAAQNNPDDDAVMKHRLTKENVQKMFAVERALVKAMNENPELAKRTAGKTTPGIDASAKAMEEIPEVARILKEQQLSAREYLLTVMASFSASIMHEFLESGKMKEVPPGISTANVEFWKSMDPALKTEAAEGKKLRAEIQKRAR